MKKIYNQPTCLVVELRGRDAMLTSISATDGTTGLGDVGFGGTTSTPNGGVSVTSADTKGISDVNLWDEEW